VTGEAEVFVLADQTAIPVFGQIRDAQWETTLPPLLDMPGADQPVPLRQAINHLAYDSWVPTCWPAERWTRSDATGSTAICSAPIRVAISNASEYGGL
jgi:hypothetical protein